VYSIPPNLESKLGASPPPTYEPKSPFLFSLLPLPASTPSVPFSFPLFSLLLFPMLYPPFPPRSLFPFSLPSEKQGRGKVLVYILNKTPTPIFHWGQAVPARYKDRSPWLCRQTDLRKLSLLMTSVMTGSLT